MGGVGDDTRLDGLDDDSSYLFVEIDGSVSEVDAQRRLLESQCLENDIQMRIASNEDEREYLWELRRAVSPSLARRGVTKVNEDVSSRRPLPSSPSIATSSGIAATVICTSTS